MGETVLAEWILKCAAGAERGSAIYGDLVELAATRDRTWFWTVYTRTLIALIWRTQIAFVIAVASVWVMCRVYPMWVQYRLGHLAAGWHVNMFFGRVAVVSGPYLNLIAMCLWFALPFAWLAFGRRDGLTRFAGILFLTTLPVWSFREWLLDVSSIATAVVLLAAILSSHWRRPFAILAITCVTGVTAVLLLIRLLAMSAGRAFVTAPTKGIGWLTITLALAIATVVCCLLHRRLLRERPTIARR